MVLEHVSITISPERTEAYLRAFDKARPQVQSMDGCHGVRLLQSVDEAGVFILLIEWETKEHHTEGFRKSEAYTTWSRLLHPFYATFPTVTYYQL